MVHPRNTGREKKKKHRSGDYSGSLGKVTGKRLCYMDFCLKVAKT